jgi:hypothetical protein
MGHFAELFVFNGLTLISFRAIRKPPAHAARAGSLSDSGKQ